MESEEITKLVDGVYKNILEKFNPGARQLITAGKGYLKSLHGAATAARLFNEALAKIAMNAQHSGTNDIGVALLNVVSVYKEIQEQQMNILKAFYVDLLVPLETNLEKDTKVVQHEQKKFLQQHKVRMESYQKAMSTMKKQRKKKSSPENTEKELRNLQLLEDQKKKLDAFCEQSYKNAMQQERRRYGFVLERQCSIAKHWMAYHTTGKSIIDNNLENWQEIAASREILPSSVYDGNGMQVGNKRLERLKDSEDIHGNAATSNQLKKSRSIDAPYGDMRTMHETNMSYTQNSLPRAKSDFNLSSSIVPTTSMIVSDHIDGGHWDQRPVVKALYAYMPSGENQLLLDEGDRIALVGGKAKGWQFGENLRTQMFGWFPVSYTNTELINDNKSMKSERHHERYDNVHYERNGSSIRSSYQEHQYRDSEHHHDNGIDSDATYRRDRADETSPTRMFGDTYRQQKKYRPPTNGNNPRPGPPPTLPAPVPSAQNATRMLNSSQSFCASNGANSAIERRKQKIQNGQQQGPSHTNMNQMKPSAAATAAKTSLHSSNDSGFANEPPPQPEIDYSDDEQPSSRVPIRRRADTNTSHAINREIASWTLSRNFRSSVDSQIDDNKSFKTLNRGSNGKMMKYDLIASDDELLQASSSGGIKRTKSFWKFGGGRSDDILAGMSLWQHRDLVTARNVEELRDEGYRTTSSKMESEREMDKTDTLTKSNSILSSPSQENQPPRKESITSLEMYDDDENIYGMTSVSREPVIVQNSRNSTGFTPKSRMKIMKTIEIDIENPAENERLNTLKRGQKAEYRENNMIHDQQQQQLQYKQQHLNNRNSIMENKTKQNSRLNHGNHKKSYDMKTNQHHTSGNNQGRQGLVSSQNRHKSEEAFPSTESEAGESELDNGTLKMSDVNNFFDNNGTGEGIIMKTVKRKDILKQYYTSEEESDEPDIKSTSSDPYDCIVINDHLVRKDEKHRRALQMQEHQMEFQTFRATTSTTTSTTAAPINSSNTKQKQKLHHGDVERNRSTNKQMYDQQDQERYNNTLTRQGSNIITTPTATILPRTRLMKSSASMTLERSSNNVGQSQSKTNNMNGNNKRDEHYGKTYGPWYDFWDQQDNIPQNQKANKMK